MRAQDHLPVVGKSVSPRVGLKHEKGKMLPIQFRYVVKVESPREGLKLRKIGEDFKSICGVGKVGSPRVGLKCILTQLTGLWTQLEW